MDEEIWKVKMGDNKQEHEKLQLNPFIWNYFYQRFPSSLGNHMAIIWFF